MPPVTLACHAMATRFELVLHGDNPVALRAAGEEALDEVERLEAQLSLFRPSSEIAHLNARAAREPVRVTPPVFALLQHAQQLCTGKRRSVRHYDCPAGALLGVHGRQRPSACSPPTWRKPAPVSACHWCNWTQATSRCASRARA